MTQLLSLDALFVSIREKGITLSIEGGHLRIKAPRGILDDQLRRALAYHKATLLDVLQRTSASACVAPVAERPERIPLSSAQRGAWFVSRFDDSGAYNMPAVIELKGVLRQDYLREALNLLCARHEPLRTIYPVVDGDPVQQVEPPRPIDLPEVDLRSFSPSERDAKLAQLIQRDATTSFDLERGPVVRATLVCTEETRSILLVTIHHIAADLWSMGIVFRELAALYDDLVNQRGSMLPPLVVQFADFALWQRRWVEGADARIHRTYWAEQLEGAPSLIAVPTDRPRPSVQTFVGGAAPFKVPTEVVERLRRFTRESGFTRFQVLLSVYALFLSRYSGQDDVVIGSPFLHRDSLDLERAMGYFADTLAYRFRINDQLNLREFVADARTVLMDAFEHRQMPFEQVVQALKLPRNLSYNPIYQVGFGLQQAGPGALFGGGVTFSLLPGERHDARLDLYLRLQDTGDSLVGELGYNHALFDATTAERMADHFVTLLANLVTAPDRPVGQAAILGPTERSRMAVSWNETKMAYRSDLTIHQVISDQAARSRERIAIRHGERSISYAQLEGRSNKFARLLVRRGVKSGSFVVLCVERSCELFVAILGILKAGAAYVPVDPTHPRERLHTIARDAAATIVVTELSLKALWERADIDLVCIDEAELDCGEEPEEPLEALVGPRDLAYVIYTSGSTGLPKGVQIEHRSLVNLVTSMARLLSCGIDDVVLALTTVSFDMSVPELFLALSVGARIELVGREVVTDARALARILEGGGVSLMQGTPATWRMLLASGWKGSPRLKAIAGGEAVPTSLAGELLGRCGEVWNFYGPTETTVWSTARRITEVLPERVGADEPIGKPIANTKVFVLDKRSHPVPPGVAGEIHIAGDGVSRGYLNRPELTAERFVASPFEPGEHLYRTGDLGTFQADGTLVYLGRSDRQVKVRGFRIELGDVEAGIQSCAGIRDAAVIDVPSPSGGRRLAAFCVVQPGVILGISEVRESLRERVPAYMIPEVVVFLEMLPLSSNGKVDRKRLIVPEDWRPAPQSRLEMPASDLELQIAAVWKDALAIPQVSVQDNFFDLGGNSILMVMVHERLCRELKAPVTIVDLFQFPTISSLARRVAGLEDNQGLPDTAQPSARGDRVEVVEDLRKARVRARRS